MVSSWVSHFTHNTTLKSKLTDIAESCTKLLLVGISHGEVGNVIDPNEERVPISHMEQAIHESNLSPNTPKVRRGCLTVYYSHKWYSHNSTPNMIMFSLSEFLTPFRITPY